MKKLIVLSVVFALVASAAFAVDLGASVTGSTTLFQSSTEDDAKVTTDANMNRIRLQGDGATEDGKFGGWIRVEGGMSGNAWWKPIDQVKVLIGGNGWDGFIGKEGVTGWMFQQTAFDTDVTFGGAGIWAPNIYGFGNIDYRNTTADEPAFSYFGYRSAFFEGGGDGGNALYLFITPLEILGINIILPVFNGGETADVFSKVVAQIDLKFGFGNIAFTYQGGLGTKDAVAGTTTWEDEIDDPASLFVYYGGSFGDLSIDFGLGYKLAGQLAGKSYNNPISIGLGVKYATEGSFGIKFRTVVSIPAEDDQFTMILAEILPYIPLGEKLTVFINAGLGIWMPSKDMTDSPVSFDSVIGWHFNPYLQVGEEWGAKFLFGFKVWSGGKAFGSDDDAIIKWAVPIAISVGF